MIIDLTQLTTKERELFSSLVQLGDSEQVAYQTVIADRERQKMLAEADTFYRNAYGYIND